MARARIMLRNRVAEIREERDLSLVFTYQTRYDVRLERQSEAIATLSHPNP
jgi:hypothetical protein